MPGRAGIATVLIDPHEVYPFDFRVEKLSGDALLERFSRTGIADSALREAPPDGANRIAIRRRQHYPRKPDCDHDVADHAGLARGGCEALCRKRLRRSRKRS